MGNNYNEIGKIPFQMIGEDGCTAYCIANLLNTDEHILNATKYPFTTTSKEVELFLESGLSLYHFGIVHPALGEFPEYFLVRVQELIVPKVLDKVDKGYIVFMARVRGAEQAIHNVLLFINLENGSYLTLDPAKKYTIYHTTLTTFFKYSGDLVGLSLITDKDGTEPEIFTDKRLKHLQQ